MKKTILLWVLLVTLIAAGACTRKTVVVKKPAPAPATKVVVKSNAPGQVKKATGSKSAAPYAPGQVKKSSSAAPASGNKTSESSAEEKKKADSSKSNNGKKK